MENNIIRVFPRKTTHTPNDDMVFIGDPPMIRPDASEVHISIVFTWDIEKGKRLAEAWSQYYRRVFIGGPAFNDSYNCFSPGKYVRLGITFTSRGCNNQCPWCLVPFREGKIKELPIKPGYVIQDNNLLQCSKNHIRNVFEMLKTQSRIQFSGGLDSTLFTSEIADEVRNLRICQLFFACDNKASLKPLNKAGDLLKDIPRDKKRCYVLLGYNGDTLSDCVERLQAVWAADFMPFAQLYQPPDRLIKYDDDWRQLQRNWSRPAITKSIQGSHK